MKRMITPMLGGGVTSALLESLIYPVIFFLWKEKALQSRLVPSKNI